jgi:hypothetical protein
MPMNRARLKDVAIHFFLFSSLRYPLCFDMRGKAAKYGLLECLVLKLYYEEALHTAHCPTILPSHNLYELCLDVSDRVCHSTPSILLLARQLVRLHA